jgi:hypothetical protein
MVLLSVSGAHVEALCMDLNKIRRAGDCGALRPRTIDEKGGENCLSMTSMPFVVTTDEVPISEWHLYGLPS